ncbi:MAG TPA: hypothetical protein VH796_18845 [Nitrososphaeraceae archaeon]|jgi:hypothetical protein
MTVIKITEKNGYWKELTPDTASSENYRLGTKRSLENYFCISMSELLYSYLREDNFG